MCAVGGEFYGYLRRFDDARAVLDRAVAIAPDSETAHANKAGILQSEGRLLDAARELAQVRDDATDDFVVSARVAQAVYERDFPKATAVVERKLKSLKPDEAVDSWMDLAIVNLGFCHQWMGQQAEAQ